MAGDGADYHRAATDAIERFKAHDNDGERA
jgi:hypothetical protein